VPSGSRTCWLPSRRSGVTARGEITDGLVFDAVRVRLIEIGEAIKDLPSELLATEPDIPWQDIARMRDRLAHRYFDTSHAIVAATVTNDLPFARGSRRSIGRATRPILTGALGLRPLTRPILGGTCKRQAG
jgi:uncharacterized protein with HEPN domain